MKRILIIDPYLDTLGGGEEHILSMAKVLNDYGYEVVVAWNDESIEKKIKERFRIDFTKLEFVIGFNYLSALERFRLTSQFEYLIYATDGSYFFSGAKNNYIFSMYPKEELFHMSLLNKLKLHNFNFIANSAFTKRFLSNWINKPIDVITPYLQDDFFRPIELKKIKTIMSIGRFFGHLHSKRQDVLVDAFHKLQEKEKGWKLTLIGGLREEDKDYYDSIVKKIDGNPDIMLLPNASYETLMKSLDESMFYWHASGYGIDEGQRLDAVEHFGIAPLQGLSRGCLVCAYDAGGQRDIITNEYNGYLYNSIDQLVETTIKVSGDKSLQKKLQENAVSVAGKFNYENFRLTCSQVFRL